jgi:hypothetical protein
MNPAIKEALAKVIEEEKRLKGEHARIGSELEKLKGVRVALERANNITPTSGKAPKGTLKAAILSVLKGSKAPMTNKQIRTALKQNGYEYSLSPLHVTKQLIALLAERPCQIKRVGEGIKAAYLHR